MVRRNELSDSSGIVSRKPGGIGVTIIEFPGVPTDAVQGFAPGCIWLNVSGALGSAFYVNVGTFTSSNWLNIA
jgi:hypothetical protein